MIANKEVQHLENSAVKLTVTVEKDAAKKQYQDLLANYAKHAQIRGFRKGKAPAKILEQKYGEGIREEATVKLIEESLKQVFEEIEEKPLPYSQPELADEKELGKIEDGEDFTFAVVYDVYPDVKLGSYEGFEIEVPEVKVTKKDEDRELEKIQEQNSMVVEKAEGAKAAKDDIVTVNYVELDEEGKEKDESRREDFVFTVGTEYNLYKFDDDIIGMAKNEEKLIEKSFPEDYDYKELAGKSVKLKVLVTAIKEKQVPELDDELAQDVSDKYETLADLRKDIRRQLEESLEKKFREVKSEAIFDKIIEGSELAVPASMLTAELENSWQRFVQQSRMPEEQLVQFLQIQGKSKETVFEEWKPQAERSLKVQLLMEKIIEKESPEVTDDEVEAEIRKQAEENGQEFDELKEAFEKNGLMEMVKNDLRNRKGFDLLIEKNKIKTGKKADYLDFMQDKQ
ncbi:trigger factor [Sediminispirochaeta bajacaliforniensis]|uniref:trigger factor n=1 Tax=Sediminispirochaeta bajacaliforniensis TaxID=148 RepID=UPI000368FF11|nr:trigger factor [Sediminispirochaeta bajacaliforniensis]